MLKCTILFACHVVTDCERGSLQHTLGLTTLEFGNEKSDWIEIFKVFINRF